MGVAAGVGGQARRDKSEIGAVTRFRDMFHKFGKKFGKFRVPTRRRRRRDDSRLLGSILWRERASCCSAESARWWRGAERAGGRRRGVGVFESSAGVRPCVSRWSVSARHDRACSMAVESPKCWQRGLVRLVERLPGQGARAGCAQDGHTRPRTRVAVALARSGPPASTASEASRGPFLVRGERERRVFFGLLQRETSVTNRYKHPKLSWG